MVYIADHHNVYRTPKRKRSEMVSERANSKGFSSLVLLANFVNYAPLGRAVPPKLGAVDAIIDDMLYSN